MDKLAQVLGILRALRSVATQANYTDVYKGMEAQCVSTYRKCIGILKSVKDYEDIESIAPDLSDSANMNEIGFAVEMLLSIVRSEEGNSGFSVGMHIPHPPRVPRLPRFWHRGSGRGKMTVCSVSDRGHRRNRAEEAEMRREMKEKLEEEQEEFEDEIEEIQDEMEELQDKMDEARERLEERLEEIREEYEEKLEELNEECDDEDEDEDEDEDVDDDRTDKPEDPK